MARAAPTLVPIRTAREAADLLAARLTDWRKERLVVLHLDRQRCLLDCTEIEGCSLDVAMPIRLIIAAALACEARGLVLAHNHPSGDPEPSEADRRATRWLAAVAEPLGIEIHDHLVFGAGECRSFRALGLL